MKKKDLIFFALIGLLFFLFSFEFFEIQLFKEVEFTSCQPKEIDYGSMSPYCLKVMKIKLLLSTRYIVIISNGVNSEYGNVFNYPSTSIFGPEEFKNLKVFWDTDSVDMITIWNVKVSIPSKTFVGGR